MTSKQEAVPVAVAVSSPVERATFGFMKKDAEPLFAKAIETGMLAVQAEEAGKILQAADLYSQAIAQCHCASETAFFTSDQIIIGNKANFYRERLGVVQRSTVKEVVTTTDLHGNTTTRTTYNHNSVPKRECTIV